MNRWTSRYGSSYWISNASGGGLCPQCDTCLTTPVHDNPISSFKFLHVRVERRGSTMDRKRHIVAFCTRELFSYSSVLGLVRYINEEHLVLMQNKVLLKIDRYYVIDWITLTYYLIQESFKARILEEKGAEEARGTPVFTWLYIIAHIFTYYMEVIYIVLCDMM